MGGYSAITDPTYRALSEDDDVNKDLAGLMSPAPAHSLVGPPPDTAPRHEVAKSTPLTGNLAAAPTQAVAKNRDAGTGYDTGTSNPPDGGNVSSIVSPASMGGIRPAVRPGSAAPLMPGSVGGTSLQPAIPAGNPQQVTPDRLNMQTQQDQQKLAQLQAAPTGGRQINNRWGRIGAQILDTAGSIVAPGVAQYIPGSTLNQQRLIGRQQGVVASDQGQQQARATLEDTTQQGIQRGAKAQQDLADAQRDALRNPTAKEADLYNLDPEAQYRPTELGKLAIEANRGAKPDSVQGMYAAAIKDAIDRGVDPMKDPKVQSLQDAQTSVQKTPATKAEQRDDRAIEILSKPPGQRTPGENAYMSGYNQWVKETKVDPGTARMSVLLQQPIAAADPNNPGGEKFVTKKDAIGMGAPGGVDTTAPKALVKDFTSGPDAKTLTNINTAADHLKLLRSTVGALKNGDYQLLNKWGQEWAKQTGNPSPTNFNMVRDALAGEVSKTFTGAAATIPEIETLTRDINNAQSPDVLNGVLDKADALMAAKRKHLKEQYDQGMQGKPNFSSSGPSRDPNMLYARDPNGKLHSSPKAGAKPLPPGWKYDVPPAGGK